ncbi:MAG: hypothetical protein DSY42_09485 [Aquifex sp.]|nr:MAG: hypothetical protein DSY42_09485 [Aquifex sp.]
MARIYRDKKTGIYYIDYTIEGRRVRKSLGTRDRKLAELKLKEIEVEIAKGRLGFQPSIDKWDFFDVYSKYVKVNKSKETARKDIYVLEKFFEWVPVDKLDKITVRHVESYKNYLILNRGLAKTTVNIHLRHLKSAFNYAVKLGYLNKSPFESVSLFTIPEKGRLRIITEEEEEKIIDFLYKKNGGKKMVAVFKVLLYTGMRVGEFGSLTWDEVDFKERLIKIINKENWNTKTKRVRTVPIPEVIVDDLKYLKKVSPKKPCPFSAYYISEFIRDACLALGLEPASAHTLRHTYASRLAMKGVSLYAIAKLLGHSSIATTQIYAKFLPNKLKDVVDFAFGNQGEDDVRNLAELSEV